MKHGQMKQHCKTKSRDAEIHSNFKICVVRLHDFELHPANFFQLVGGVSLKRSLQKQIVRMFPEL